MQLKVLNANSKNISFISIWFSDSRGNFNLCGCIKNNYNFIIMELKSDDQFEFLSLALNDLIFSCFNSS